MTPARQRRAAAGLAVVAGAGLFASAAQAFVQSRTDSTRMPTRWGQRCVHLDLLVADPPDFVAPDLFRNAAIAAATVWNPETTGCSDFVISIAASPIAEHSVAWDNIDVVQFRRTFWGRNPADPSTAYDSRALAITSVWAQKSDGIIVDTDVDLNAVHFNWGDVVTAPSLVGQNTQDLQNTLTHEFGHVLGLDHNCTSTEQPDLLDNTGVRPPPCTGAPAAVADATMFVSVAPGDTARRDLSADDVLGVCTLYPKAGPTASQSAECLTPESSQGGCGIAPGLRVSNLSLAAVAALALAALRGARRRRRMGPSGSPRRRR